MVKKAFCPYIGLKEDQNTSLNFPSTGNHCYHARPLEAVNPQHQQKFCLSSNHQACPVYRSAELRPLPTTIAAAAQKDRSYQRALLLLAIPFLIGCLALLTITWSVFGDRLSRTENGVPETGDRANQQDSVLFPQLNGSESSSTPFSPHTATATPIPLIANCALPQGWIPYVVKPTDSLFRLSAVYGIEVSEIQTANCMGKSTFILPDQVIYIPFVPTSTPSATPTRPRIAIPTTSAPVEEEDIPVIQPTEAPPSQAQPPVIVPSNPPPAITAPTDPIVAPPADPPSNNNNGNSSDDDSDDKGDKNDKKDKDDKKDKKDKDKDKSSILAPIVDILNVFIQ